MKPFTNKPVALLTAAMVLGILTSSAAWGAEPAEAIARVFCVHHDEQDNPFDAEMVLRGLFGKNDTNTFNLDCDHAEAFDSVVIQEIGSVLAISGPAAQAQARAKITVEVSIDPVQCPPGAKANGFGATYASSLIELGISIESKQPPPITLGTLPGIAIISGSVNAEINPAPETLPEGENYAFASIGFANSDDELLGEWNVEISDGTDSQSIDKVISLDMITSGEEMRFKKAAYSEVELSSVESCDTGGKSDAFAQSIIDPIFEFDQERFDLEQGSQSFPLDEYYTILVSPNLNELLARDGFEGE